MKAARIAAQAVHGKCQPQTAVSMTDRHLTICSFRESGQDIVLQSKEESVGSSSPLTRSREGVLTTRAVNSSAAVMIDLERGASICSRECVERRGEEGRGEGRVRKRTLRELRSLLFSRLIKSAARSDVRYRLSLAYALYLTLTRASYSRREL